MVLACRGLYGLLRIEFDSRIIFLVIQHIPFCDVVCPTQEVLIYRRCRSKLHIVGSFCIPSSRLRRAQTTTICSLQGSGCFCFLRIVIVHHLVLKYANADRRCFQTILQIDGAGYHAIGTGFDYRLEPLAVHVVTYLHFLASQRLISTSPEAGLYGHHNRRCPFYLLCPAFGFGQPAQQVGRIVGGSRSRSKRVIDSPLVVPYAIFSLSALTLYIRSFQHFYLRCQIVLEVVCLIIKQADVVGIHRAVSRLHRDIHLERTIRSHRRHKRNRSDRGIIHNQFCTNGCPLVTTYAVTRLLSELHLGFYRCARLIIRHNDPSCQIRAPCVRRIRRSKAIIGLA